MSEHEGEHQDAERLNHAFQTALRQTFGDGCDGTAFFQVLSFHLADTAVRAGMPVDALILWIREAYRAAKQARREGGKAK